MPDEQALADIAQAEAIEASRVAIAFKFMHTKPCEGDLDRLKRMNMAAYLIVVELLKGEKEGAKA